MLHRLYAAQAGLDSGAPNADSEISELAGASYKLCDDPADEKTCTGFGDFKADTTGKSLTSPLTAIHCMVCLLSATASRSAPAGGRSHS